MKNKVYENKQNYYRKNKQKYIQKVIYTINAIKNLTNFDSLIELIYGIFTYRYTNIKGSLKYGTSRVQPSLDQDNILDQIGL